MLLHAAACLALLQVWHNYSFDRHVLERMGLAMRGFAGDTMHMARLWDSSRVGRGGYSLEALSGDANLMGEGEEPVRGKVSMKKLFGQRNIKADGTPGKVGRGGRQAGVPAGGGLLRAGQGCGSRSWQEGRAGQGWGSRAVEAASHSRTC